MVKKVTVCVVGLGYVGLPLAVEFAKHFTVYGFDLNENRIAILKKGNDPNREVESDALKKTTIEYSSDPAVIGKAGFIIVAVPTPVDEHKIPDLTPLIKATETVGKNMRKGTIVVYESTVYPGVTEDTCVPILEKESNLLWKKDFFVGYSPERINPGDREHTVSRITKVVSGDTQETLETISTVYGTMVKAGVYRASSIKVAEAAKVIENTQRDINIALMNELRMIFDKMGISTMDVLAAARTKWNFLPFEPGLVGGHCIGVDPYYLAFMAEELGHHPQIIMAGRRINDDMGKYFARQIIKKMVRKSMPIKNAKALMLGITFKENVPDIRNSKILDIINELEEFGIKVDLWDPVANPEDVRHEYRRPLVAEPEKSGYNVVILGVKHRQFLDLGQQGLLLYLKSGGFFYDVKEAMK
jgi:UDP-N-acetyl-D-glucosamine/UDP-N-acetyl-D-galactosamine dehydrogenase